LTIDKQNVVEGHTKYTNLGVVRKALDILMSRNPLKYSQRPIEMHAMAATNSKDASDMELAVL
jgi:hypothetical protein